MMAAATASRSLMGRWAQMCWLGMASMVTPPGDGHSLEGCHQFFNGGHGKDRGLDARLTRQIGGRDGNVANLSRLDLDLTVLTMPRQCSETYQPEGPAEKRMLRVGDGDVAIALLRDQRCITLAGVWLVAVGLQQRRYRGLHPG
jgi:hypothetical protein